MSSEMNVYNKFLLYKNDGTILPTVDPIKVMLLTDVYEFDASHEVLTDVLTSPNPEVEEIVSPSNGYIQGGQTLQNCALNLAESPLLLTFDADDPVWLLLTASFRYALFYANVTRNDVIDPLMFCVLLDNTPDDIVVNGVDYTLRMSSLGIYTDEVGEVT